MKRLRLIQGLSTIVVALGFLAGSAASQEEYVDGCEHICSTYCPADMIEYCRDVANCGTSGGGCAAKECLAPVYSFAKTISCATGSGGE